MTESRAGFEMRDAELSGRRRGHQEAADHLERVAAEWSGTEGGDRVARALRLEARNVRRMTLADCTRRGQIDR